MPIVPTEQKEQSELVGWLDRLAGSVNDLLYFAVPNGGFRLAKASAANLKRAGLVAGVPDLCIPTARPPHHGLFIEMKRAAGGEVSLAQRMWIDRLTRNGYRVEVCRGAEAAKAIVLDYLGTGEGELERTIVRLPGL